MGTQKTKKGYMKQAEVTKGSAQVFFDNPANIVPVIAWYILILLALLLVGW